MTRRADLRPCRGAGSALAALGIALVLCAFPVGARCDDLAADARAGSFRRAGSVGAIGIR